MAGQKGQPAGLRPVESVDSEDLLAENVKRLVRAVAGNRLAPEPDEFTPYAFTVIRTPQAQQLLKPTEPHCKRLVNEDTALKNTICRGNTEQVNFIWNREPTSMPYIGERFPCWPTPGTAMTPPRKTVAGTWNQNGRGTERATKRRLPRSQTGTTGKSSLAPSRPPRSFHRTISPL